MRLCALWRIGPDDLARETVGRCFRSCFADLFGCLSCPIRGELGSELSGDEGKSRFFMFGESCSERVLQEAVGLAALLKELAKTHGLTTDFESTGSSNSKNDESSDIGDGSVNAGGLEAWKSRSVRLGKSSKLYASGLYSLRYREVGHRSGKVLTDWDLQGCSDQLSSTNCSKI